MAIQNGDRIRREIFEAGLYTQFLGVTAGLFGFIVVKSWHNLLWEGSPIFFAYGVTILTMLGWWLDKSFRLWNTIESALKYIYFVFICGDIALLGLLVLFTGGSGRSIFMPIFLLIPVVATCFCDPRKKFFWRATVATVITFIFVSVWPLAVKASLSSSTAPSLAQTSSSPSTASSLAQTSSSSSTSGEIYERLCLNLFNIFGIGTAAVCYFCTYRTRLNYCKRQIEPVDNHCSPLYL